MNELKYTLKLLSKNIRFSLLCTSIVAIGIALVLPFYSLVENISPAELPLAEGDRFVLLQQTAEQGGDIQESFLYDNFHYQYFKTGASSFANLSAWRDMPLTLSDGEFAQAFSGAEIEPVLLELTGIAPIMGRTFSADDADSGATPVAIISHDAWQSYYSGREDIIGHQSRIRGEMRNIVGVMPETFAFPIFHDVWLPLQLAAPATRGSAPQDLYLVGLRAEDASLIDASREIALLQAQIGSSWTEDYGHIATSEVLPYASVAGGLTDGISILFLTVLLLVMFNAANLFVVRGAERIEELAIRSAMGADHRQMAKALMLESFLVCLFGLVAGLLLAWVAIAALAGLIADVTPGFTALFWWDVSLRPHMVLESTVMTGIVWLVSGGLPAWRISRSQIDQLIAGQGKGLRDTEASRTSKVLVNAQLVMSCLLLTLGMFTVLTWSNTTVTQLPSSATLFSGNVDFTGDYLTDPGRGEIYRANLASALEAEAAVDSVVFTTGIPGRGGSLLPYETEDMTVPDSDAYPRQYSLSVSENYFDLLGNDLLQGRGFGLEDISTSLPVAIVDERLVAMYWPDAPVLGKRIRLNPGQDGPWLTIVGVSRAQAQESTLQMEEVGTPVLYRPLRQANPNRFFVLFRAADPAIDYRRALGSAATSADRDVSVRNVQSVAEFEATRLGSLDFNSDLGSMFVLVALYLTGIATYGLAARAIASRQLEIGVRMALGAGRSSCIRTILRDGVLMVATGLSLGGMLAILGTYGVLTAVTNGLTVPSFEILISTTGAVGLSMAALVLLANYIPARRLVAMEPGEALHYE